MTVHRAALSALAILACLSMSTEVYAQRQLENLGRGVVARNRGNNSVYVGWRLLAKDPAGTAFNVYRATGTGQPVKLNSAPITTTTDFVDNAAALTSSLTYTVRPVLDGVEYPASTGFTLPAAAPARLFQTIPLQIPAGGTTPDGVAYTYSANDASAGDLDGDGEYEIVLKWDPSNSKDNSQSGYTGNVYLDAYKLNGTRLWRIDLGRNIRAGAHYTQFIVYDLDGDGKAEVACKTADGTRDGVGTVIGSASADYRNASGYILTGPEFLTVFNGQTGAAMATTNYVPARGTVSSWGDSYGNRVDRFLAGVAYVDGSRPSLIMCRGYYTRAVVVAWDWRNGALTRRWTFDSNSSTPGNSTYAGQGAHSLSVGDVDADGRDEIVYGAATINDNGAGLYSTGYGHGDALHMSDMIPSRPGQEIFMVHESQSAHQGNGGTLIDARTGALIYGVTGGTDVGRGVAGDVDPGYPGFEMWTSANANLWNATSGDTGVSKSNIFQNFLVWWDADLSRELLDGTTISNWTGTGRSNIVASGASGLNNNSGVSSNNSTKATPALSADLLGDWREEIVWRTSDNTALQIWSTGTPATNRLYTLMHDTQYRVAIAWQNVAYNQPPHPSFFLGTGMATPPTPNASYAGNAAPAFSSFTINDAAAQRSRVLSLRLDFNEAVTLDPPRVSLTRRSGGGATVAIAPSADRKAATLTFSGTSVVGASLPDGVYDLRLPTTAARDAALQPLSGADRTFTFHRLFGDIDGNRAVNNADHNAFKAAFGKTTGAAGFVAGFDYDANGAINNADYNQFKLRYGQSVTY